MKKKTPKLYPLTSAQMLHFFTLKYCSKKQVLNIGTSLTIEGDIIDFDVLKKAIIQAYQRCEAMRVRFCEKNGQTFQYISDEIEENIEYQDFSSWRLEEAEAQLRRWSEIPFNRDDSQMNRIVMITMPDGYKGLYLNVDHMIMDSCAIIVFMKDLVELYSHMRYDYPFPKPMASYEDVLIKDLEYDNDSVTKKNDEAFWKEFIGRAEPIFTDITGDSRLQKQREEMNNPNLRSVTIVSDSVEAQHDEFHLEGEPAARMMNFCLENRIPMLCLIMLGLRTFLSKMNNEEPDIGIKSTISRRGSIQKKKCGGTRIHFFPCRTNIPPETTFMEALQIIQRSQFEIFRHADFDPVAFMNMVTDYYNLAPGQAYECMALTYQPMTMKARTEELSNINYKAKWYSNGAAASPLYLTIMHNSVDEGLDFYFEYQLGRVKYKDLEYLYYYLCRIIFKGMENPDITIGEILHTV